MGDSMLVYSEKMRRISRNRFPQAAPMSGPQIGNVSKTKKGIVLHETEPTAQSWQSAEDTKPGRPLRSLSDAANHKALRGRHLARKKTSLDMTGTFANNDLNKASNPEKNCHIISSAWETSDCVYQRQRRRGVTAVPKLETLSLKDKSSLESTESNSDGSSLPSISIYPHEFVPARTSSCLPENSNDGESNLWHESHSPVIYHSEQGVSWNNIAANRKCPRYSEVSQLVLRSFAPEITRSPESSVGGRFSDTSAAELDLLRKTRYRLSSSSAPTSPVPSTDEEDEDDVRRRTHSLSLPCKTLKSVLKKPNICRKKKLTVGNSKHKTVSFKSPDVIRVISRCSGDYWETTSFGGACQSQSTIVVISD